jgi:hypothetical protein
MKNGEFHRDDGLPAIDLPSGFKAWYTHGVLVKKTGNRLSIHDDAGYEFIGVLYWGMSMSKSWRQIPFDVFVDGIKISF